MGPVGRRIAAACLLTTALGLGPLERAQAVETARKPPAKPGIKILSGTDGVLTTSIETVERKGGLTVEVLNRLGEPTRVRARLILPRQVSPLLQTAQTKKLRPGAITTFHFAPREKPSHAGTFVGLLRLRRLGDRYETKTLRIMLSVGEEGAAARKLAMIAYRVAPAAGGIEIACEQEVLQDCTKYVPLRPFTEVAALPVKPGMSLGALTGNRGGVIEVTWTKSEALPGEATGLALQLEGSSQPDTYSGTIDLLPDVDSVGEVELTVTLRDHWYWPAAVLIIGALLGWVAKRWIGTGARLSRLREDAALAAEKFQSCSAPPHYTIEAEANKRYEQLLAQIDELRRGSGLTLSDTDPQLKAIVTNLETMRASSSTWCDLAVSLVALGDAVRAAKESARTHSVHPAAIDESGSLTVGGPELPVWVKGAEKLLVPDSPVALTFETLADLKQGVLKATALAKSWNALDSHLTWLEQFLALIRDPAQCTLNDDQRKEAVEAQALISEARWELWYAVDADDLQRRTTNLDIQQAERIIARLQACLHPEVRIVQFADANIMSFITDTSERGISLTLIANVADMPEAKQPAPPANVIRWEETHRRFWNRLAMGVLVAALLIAGLNELYFNNATFGRPSDYLVALAWGLSAKVAVDILGTAFETLRRTRLPIVTADVEKKPA